MNESQGQVVTFYSFKGGTGRTMALANVAWILAASGKRVLVADWDLESPGLHRFFRPYLDPARIAQASGVIDMIREFEWKAGPAGSSRPDGTPIPRPENWYEEYAKVKRHAISIEWSFPGQGTLDFLAAGRQNSDYATTVSGLDWDTFFNNDGGRFFQALREDMKKNYDYALIDSRTGLSDVADICTIHLPDTLVDCFTFSEQGIEGAAQVANTISGKYKNMRRIRILPVPMRVDQGENEKVAAGRAVAMRHFAKFPADLSGEDRVRYWTSVEVPYKAFYAYEETLATFGDLPGQSLLTAFEKLTDYVTNGAVASLPPMEESLRQRELEKFRRRVESSDTEIMLWSAPEDQVWAEWVGSLLLSAGVRVSDATKPTPPGVRTMAIISSSSLTSGLPTVINSRVDGHLAVYVTDVRQPLATIPMERSAFVANATATSAADKILRLLGRVPGPDAAGGTRYPGSEPMIFNPPGRNPLFTGRDAELLSLREQLRSRGGVVVLQGSSGYGKTQVALEYAHRFRNAYDVVWWISAEQSNLVDMYLVELSTRLGLNVGLTAVESSQQLLATLSRGDRVENWLLIYDSADDVEHLVGLLPAGTRGHTLVTSRDPGWTTLQHYVDVNVFRPEESVAHLRRRLSTITEAQAGHIADVFENLPFAISAAGAYLTDTGTPVADYLQQIESGSVGIEAALEQWRRSADALAEQSPGAHRLLELCSVLAGETALELIYGDEMAAELLKLDPAVSTRDGRGRLVQHLNRLAMIKLDAARGQMHVHRLLRRVMQQRMSAEELADTRRQMHLFLAASSPRGEVDDPATWRRFRLLWPHIIESGADTSDDERVCRMLIDRVRYLWLQGDLRQGAELGAVLVARWTERLAASPNDKNRQLQLFDLRFNLANILRSMGRFADALAIDEDVLAQQQAAKADNLHILRTSGSLAADMRGLGRYADALMKDQITHPAYVRELGEEHPRTLTAANNLATAYRLMGNFRAARTLDESIYAKRQAADKTHPYTHASATNLGRDHRDAGEYDRALNLLRTVYDEICAARGEDSVEAYLAQANLAVSLRSAGKAAEAMPLLDSAYTHLTNLRGETSPDTLGCRLSRAANLLAMDLNQAADEEMRAVVAAYTRQFGPDHPHTLAAQSNLSATLRALNQLPEARLVAERAATNLVEILSAEHPFTIGARMNQAICLAELDEPGAAQPIMESALEILNRTIGPEHPDSLRVAANLALTIKAKDDSKAATAAVEHAINRLARSLSPQHPTVQALQLGKYAHRIIEPHPF